MTNKELEALMYKVADKAVTVALNRLKNEGRITYYFSDSFTKTEDLLYLYPKLPANNETRIKIDQALEKIKDDKYYGLIHYRYFEDKTFEQIAEIFDCQSKNASKHRNKLIRKLAAELFPEDVLREIINK